MRSRSQRQQQDAKVADETSPANTRTLLFSPSPCRAQSGSEERGPGGEVCSGAAAKVANETSPQTRTHAAFLPLSLPRAERQ
jgi:hypothetical protein